MTWYRWALVGLFVLAWVLAAINPVDRGTWIVENILVVMFAITLVLLGRYFLLSDVSYTFITLFLVLHLIGAHWTYSYVPIGQMLGDFIGSHRNMYDRIVHFSFGLLMVYPIREIFLRVTGAKGFWGYYFPLDVVMSFSAIYEIIEWITAYIADPATAASFMGSQGDIWDTQKDMASAGVGALIAVCVVFGINYLYNRKLGAEMRESFRIKDSRPYGERTFSRHKSPFV
jgi:putative membrane protein